MKRAAVQSIVVAVLLLAVAVIAAAQQPKKIPHIGVLYPGLSEVSDPPLDGIPQGLRDLGLAEEKTRIEYGSRRESLIGCLISRLSWSVLRLTSSAVGVRGDLAAKNATSTIPIVWWVIPSPRESVDSLARPGGKHHGANDHDPRVKREVLSS